MGQHSRTRQNKDWLDDFEFGEVPPNAFEQYDEMWRSLAYMQVREWTWERVKVI